MKPAYKILSWLVALLLPILIVLGVVRLLMNPFLLEVEYRTPGFPADEYGFTLQDRLDYGKKAVEYLVNSAGIAYLGDLRFPGGQQTPPASCQYMSDCSHLFNDRELEHMLDVKNLVQGSMRVLGVTAALLLVLLLWAWLSHWMQAYLRGLSRGGIVTIVVLGIIILLALTLFQYIFILFHEIFFRAGTWTFLYSDTLIRLFPERFWQDMFLYVGGLAAGLGLLCYFGFRKLLITRKTVEK